MKKLNQLQMSIPKCVEPAISSSWIFLNISAGEKSVISIVHPVVTVKRTFLKGRKYRQESISVLKDEPESLWVDVLPRTTVKDRFVVIEQTRKSRCKGQLSQILQKLNDGSTISFKIITSTCKEKRMDSFQFLKLH